jgi:hypothetical protein
VEGTVTFNAQGGVVTADADHYVRQLPPPEAEHLRTAIDAAAHAANSPQKPSPARDAYSYSVTDLADDGKTHAVTLDTSPAGSNTFLSNWVQEECQRIWESRISK